MSNRPEACILLADDEPLFLQSTAELLRRAGYECRTASDATTALQILAEGDIDLAIVDLNMPGNLDLQLLNEGRRRYPDVPMLVVTGAPSLNSAIDSVRLHISDYLLKPIRFEEILAGVRRALAGRSTKNVRTAAGEIAVGETDLALDEPDGLLGTSPEIDEVLRIVQRVAPLDVNVLILGESGTGKELIAQALHRASRRRSQPFVTIDCTAIPELLFESMLFGHVKGAFTSADRDQPGLLKDAAGGTVFLDEIGELAPSSQAKLLRLLQHRTFTPVGQHRPQMLDVRFVAATNRDLETQVAAGQFRADLFYRLAVVPIELPPLRERGNDTLLLAEHFLQEFQSQSPNGAAAFSAEAKQALINYSWPGNVRELRNVVERSAALCQTRVIEVGDLPKAIQTPSVSPVSGTDVASESTASSRLNTLLQADQTYLLNLLKANDGNVSQAAASAGISRQAMYKLMRKHGITPDGFRSQ